MIYVVYVVYVAYVVYVNQHHPKVTGRRLYRLHLLFIFRRSERIILCYRVIQGNGI